MIVFDRISYQNFFSVGNFPIVVNLSQKNKTLIIGKNGAGKSILPSAICYALYGQPYKPVLKPTIINSINKKKMLIELDFHIGSDQYKIKRGLKPNIFEIYHNDNLLPQDGASSDYQTYLEKNILKMSFHTFKQIVIIGNTGFTPFMKLEAAKRRNMIENILDLGIFSNMNALAKSDMVEKKREFDDLKNILFKLNVEHQSAKDKLQYYETQKNSVNKEFIENVEQKISKIEETLSKFPLDFPDYESKLTDVDYKIRVLETKKASLKTEINYALEEKSLLECETCPTCKQNISEEFRNRKLGEIQQKVDQTNEMISKIEKSLNTFSTQKSEFLTKKDKVNQIVTRRNILENQKSELLTEKREFLAKNQENHEIDEWKLKIDEIRSKLTASNKEEEKLLEDIEVIKQSLLILKDDGIKSQIIATYIPLINQYINKYLEMMNFYISFEIDENFDEVIKSRHRDVFKYDNFSDGEKARIDLAFLFTWRMINKMRNAISCNLLVLDEVFSGSLDGDGIEDLLLILNTMKDSNIFVISHRPEVIDGFDDVMKIEKVKNFTQVVKE